MTTYIGGARLPTVSKELLESLDSSFQRPDVRPETYRDNLMYAAGQRYVVDWIREHASKNESSGDPVKAQRVAVRLGS